MLSTPVTNFTVRLFARVRIQVPNKSIRLAYHENFVCHQHYYQFSFPSLIPFSLSIYERSTTDWIMCPIKSTLKGNIMISYHILMRNCVRAYLNFKKQKQKMTKKKENSFLTQTISSCRFSLENTFAASLIWKAIMKIRTHFENNPNGCLSYRQSGCKRTDNITTATTCKRLSLCLCIFCALSSGFPLWNIQINLQTLLFAQIEWCTWIENESIWFVRSVIPCEVHTNIFQRPDTRDNGKHFVSYHNRYRFCVDFLSKLPKKNRPKLIVSQKWHCFTESRIGNST